MLCTFSFYDEDDDEKDDDDDDDGKPYEKLDTFRSELHTN